MEVKLRAYYSWVIGTLELPIGCLGVLDGWWCFRAQSLWCKAPGKRRGLQLGCGDRPEQFVQVPVTALMGCQSVRVRWPPQGSPFVRVRWPSSEVPLWNHDILHCARAWGDYGGPSGFLGSIVPPHRSKRRLASTRVWTLGYILVSACLGYILPEPFTYALYFVIAIAFHVIYLAIT